MAINVASALDGVSQTSYRAALYRSYRSSQGLREAPDLKQVMWWASPYKKYLKGWLPADAKAPIVDVACGGGYLLVYLSHLGYQNLVGADISDEQVATARRLKQHVLQEDAIKFLARHEDHFGLVLAIDIIEHLTKNEVIQFMQAAFKSLRPGGRIVIQTPNCGSLFGVGQRYADFSHEVGFTANSLAWVLRLHRFTQIEHREQGPVIRGIRSFVRSCLWRMIRLACQVYDLAETGSSKGIYTRVFVTSAIKPASSESGRLS